MVKGRQIAAAAIVLAGSIAMVAATAGTAHACSEPVLFEITEEHLQGDFNSSTSQLAQDWREFYGDDASSIEVQGAYVVETVYSIDPDGDWSRGSVSAVFEVWGQWPTDTAPSSILSEDRSGEPPNPCGWNAQGSPTGTRDFLLVTSDGIYDFGRGQDMSAVLFDAFGPAEMADRDISEEERLIAALQDARQRSGRGVALAFGGIVIFGSILAYQYRNRRLQAAWDDVVAEREAEISKAERDVAP